MSSKRVWNSGHPPHIGWWDASSIKDGECWRWWDGKAWSGACWREDSASQAERKAAKLRLTLTGHFIEWTDYWPKNARVPRVDPRGGAA